MKKPKTARLQKKKVSKREITLQEAFDVIAEELIKIDKEHCAFISCEPFSKEAPYAERKIELSVAGDGETNHVSIVKSSKSARQLKRELLEGTE